MQNSTKKEIVSWVKSLAFAVILVVLCRQFLFSPVIVKGVSMEPTFHDKNRVIVSKMSAVERFDMIVFEAPDVQDTQYIKRVIGLPGDRVEMKDDVLLVNGKAYTESYVNKANEVVLTRVTENFTLQELTGQTTVPDGYFFVLGDNRMRSNDSLAYGYVAADTLIGVVKLQIFPLHSIGIPQ